ncbi:MAG: hypothetical protein A3J58_02360 [Candidatus Sungbacteria bacterium RIFCSPHIGHO2_02_FULL_52_23]|uniref:RNA polymerase sigma-70 region 4 domain-containing protein n=1 Tax=Candidatus Sungbacteria bacterium RIFCSPHIGHO2_02_FULL_52_23 TaxID=1802274 RepID=A0A1G2KWN5_9BACT|nr:MAG: hypothetical protein A3J58_02360 [Candidatus Sungbacteria bacterium RIFCSPHIGHO2_02_FULL_52_23]
MGESGELEQRLVACRLEPEAAKIMESWLGLSGERLHEFVPSVLRVLPGSWLSHKQIMIWQDWCIGSLHMIKRAYELSPVEFLLLCERDSFYAALDRHFPARNYKEIEHLTLRFQVKKTLKKEPGNQSVASYYALTQKQIWVASILLGMDKELPEEPGKTPWMILRALGAEKERKIFARARYASGMQVYKKIADAWQLPETVWRGMIAEDPWWGKLARYFPERGEKALTRIRERLMPPRTNGPYRPYPSSEARRREARALQAMHRTSAWDTLTPEEQRVLGAVFGLGSGTQQSYKDAGKELGVPHTTVRRRVISAQRRLNDLNDHSSREFTIPDFFVRHSAQRRTLGRSPYEELSTSQRFRREVSGLPELTDEYVALHLPFIRENEGHACALFYACLREIFPRAYRWAKRWDVQRLGFSADELIQEACAGIWRAMPTWPSNGDAAAVCKLARDAIFSGIDQALGDAGISIKRGRTSVIPNASLDDPIGLEGKTVRRDLVVNSLAPSPEAVFVACESESRNEPVRMFLGQKLSSVLTSLELAIICQRFGFEAEWERDEILGHWQITEEEFGLAEEGALERISHDNEIVAALRQITQDGDEGSFDGRSYKTGRR